MGQQQKETLRSLSQTFDCLPAHAMVSTAEAEMVVARHCAAAPTRPVGTSSSARRGFRGRSALLELEPVVDEVGACERGFEGEFNPGGAEGEDESDEKEEDLRDTESEGREDEALAAVTTSTLPLDFDLEDPESP